MKRNILFGLVMLAAGSLFAADSNPKADVTAAAATLGSAPNYSWTATFETPNGNFRRGPTEGKTEKDGYTTLTMSFNDNATLVAIRGTNAAIKSPDSDWKTAEEAQQDNGNGGFNPAAFIARMAQSYKTPAVEAGDLAAHSVSLVAGTNGIAGDLSEDAAKDMLTFRRPGATGGPSMSNAKASVTFWLADGKLSKYQVHVTGSVDFNSNTREVDRITTTEIKDVGATKIDLPDDAKKKLQ